ncbi:MAG TPA: PQQ-binding-like beta-propeller repeat protein [Rhizomicrobium sp.]|nr:PQQ-binding-like beta-propeller repeat protein [Rhizomicrobium sp.]
MTRSKKNAIAVVLATVPCVGLWAASSLAQNAGPFNAAQVDAGRTAYMASCMVCHGETLSGLGEAVPIAGKGFVATFGAKTTKDLFDTIKAEMPLTAPRSLSDETYVNLTAFLLHANGAATGNAALTPTTGVRISSVASGTVAADVAAGLKPTQTAQAAPAAGGANAAAPVGAAPAPGGARGGAAPGALPNEYTNLGLIQTGNVQNYTNVTDAMLTNPSPNDWLMYRGNYPGWSYSPLSQVTAQNVNQMQLKWTLAMNDGGTNETTPLVHDGIMYLFSPGNTVQAIKADTGEIVWQNNLGPPSPTLNPGGDVAERSLGLYGDKVIVPTMQGKIYALDARTGKVDWQTFYSDPSKPDEGVHGSDGGVIIVHGKVLIGMTNCGRIPQIGHCYISAYDANTGQRAWKFATVALTGQPGGDTWGKLPDDQRAGGETWIAGTYDPELNTTYWGTAQAKPWRRDLRGSGDGATLYANSTLALDPDTGKLKWYFNHAPGESLDLDEVFERILIDHGDQKTLMTTGKAGILWKLDRATGKYLDSRETVFQNVFTKLDPKTGTPGYRKDIIDQKTDQWLPSCPGPEGGKDWPAASYHQPDDEIIIPLSQSCVLMLGSGSEMFYEMPGSSGNMGRLSAYETNTMKPLWSLQQRSPFLTGVTSTAGNVAFVGDFDRQFHAFDTKTGKQLWTTRLGTGVEGHIASYAINGKQYIAVMTGVGGSSPQQKPSFILSQEVARPLHGNAIYVFGLPDSMQQVSNR